jgi:beta-glucosidase
LPLSRDVAKIAIIGPHADDVEAGFATYMYSTALKMMQARATGGDIAMAGVDLGGTPPPEAKAAMAAEMGSVFKTDRRQYMKSNYSAMSLAEAVRQLLPKAEVTAVAGAGVIPKEPTDIPAAVSAARNADVVILAVGGRSAWSNERTEGEGSDSANKDLPPQQVELINAVTALGKPTVAVISMGGPYALASVIEKLPAVLTDYYGGPHQATAIADAIFGVTNPGGKLPFTMPRHVGQVPIHLGQKWGSGYRRTKEDIHKGYLDMPSTPLFAFGHGLSYTTFEYSPLKLASDTVDVGGEGASVLAVTNTGKRRGTEVVQLYAADTATGVTLPAQQLIGFAPVDLEPGASKSVAFVVPMSLLGYTGLSGKLIWSPVRGGKCGQQLERIRSSAKFTVTGKTRTIRGQDRAFLSVATVGS